MWVGPCHVDLIYVVCSSNKMHVVVRNYWRAKSVTAFSFPQFEAYSQIKSINGNLIIVITFNNFFINFSIISILNVLNFIKY